LVARYRAKAERNQGLTEKEHSINNLIIGDLSYENYK
jgi:hypothetical protein